MKNRKIISNLILIVLLLGAFSKVLATDVTDSIDSNSNTEANARNRTS